MNRINDDKKLNKIILSAMFLAIALILPFFTGQIKQIGDMLCPMHFPVLLCGYFCGPWFAMIVGFMAPILRFVLFGMPQIMPTGIAMCFELASYGMLAGLLYRALPQNKVNVYVSLVLSMLGGRIIWGIVKSKVMGMTGTAFGMQAFITAGFVQAVPGIIIQIVLIPIIVITLRKYIE